MIDTLMVSNLGVIREVEAEVSTGLVAITGETGAGKTLLTTALSLLLGQRGGVELIGPSSDTARVRALLVLDGTEFTAEREITASGRSRARLDGSLVSLTELSGRTSRAIQLFGQHLAVRLASTREQVRLLDRFGGCDPSELQLHSRELTALNDHLQRLDLEEESRRKRQELLEYEIGELEAAGIDGPEEDARVSDELQRLGTLEEQRALLGSLHDSLAGDDGVTGLLHQAAGQWRHLDSGICGRLTDLASELDDLAQDLRRREESLSDDPERTAALEDRLNVLVRIKRRFGPTLADALARREEIRLELSGIGAEERDAAAGLQKLALLEQAVADGKARLASCRQKAAERLTASILDLLPAVALDGARFQVAFDEEEALYPHFEFTANVGFKPEPISRVASGGELSRLMLALATVLGSDSPSLVFDEVDTGIGGATGLSIARTLRSLGRERQVIVVTHLPQIAAAADQQLLVTKTAEGDFSGSAVRRLAGEERVAEIARMLSGQPSSELAREHARDLLSSFSG